MVRLEQLWRPRRVGHDPTWPVPPGDRVVFLVDAATPVERQLIGGWIDRHRPPVTDPHDVIVVALPTTGRRVAAPQFETLLGQETQDVWLAPITVLWTPRRRQGRRKACLRDLFLRRNPRHPSRVHQAVIDRVAPWRRAVVASEPAQLRDLRARAELAAHGIGPDETGASSFARFVAREAVLSLGRAETRLMGPRYKPARLARKDIETRESWRQGIKRLAQSAHRSPEEVRVEAERYLREMVPSASPTIDLQVDLIRRLYTQGYEPEVRHDPAQVANVRELARTHPLVFLLSHKTYFDGLLTPMFLYEHGIAPGYGMGGINLDLPVFGTLLRRGGAVFIRRGVQDNPVYRFVLREYIGYLAEGGFNLYWSPEGTRSRTGKLAPMKPGGLSYLVGAYLEGRTDDFVIVPMSFAYDELYEVTEFARYARGAKKRPESIKGLIRYIQAQRSGFGRVYVNIPEPISLRDFLGPPQPALAHDDPRFTDAVERLAFEVATRMNAVMPITGIAVLCAAMLTMPGPARTRGEIEPVVAELIDDIVRRGLPLAPEFDLGTPVGLDTALGSLARHGVVTAFEGGTEPVFGISTEAALEAAFYRNTIVHFFLNPAVAALALLAADEDAQNDPVDAVFRATDKLRELLQHEFFLPDPPAFRATIDEELRAIDADWRSRIRSGATTARALAGGVRPCHAVHLIGPLLEGYGIYADVLACAADVPFDDSLVDIALNVGVQHLTQGKLRWPESASKLIIENAHRLASDRGLLVNDSPDTAARRAAFAQEIRSVVRRVNERANPGKRPMAGAPRGAEQFPKVADGTNRLAQPGGPPVGGHRRPAPGRGERRHG